MARFSDDIRGRAGVRKQMDHGKISVRLVEFAQPMIDALVNETGTEPNQERLRNVLMIATTIWNAQVMQQLGKGSKYLDEARRLLNNGVLPQVRTMVEEMIERKVRDYPDDLRYIGRFEVYKNAQGELRVQEKHGWKAACETSTECFRKKFEQATPNQVAMAERNGLPRADGAEHAAGATDACSRDTCAGSRSK